jgi:hypothetical protein
VRTPKHGVTYGHCTTRPKLRREVLGHYVFELGRQGSSWKIGAMKLETLLQTGNTKLLAEVAK